MIYESLNKQRQRRVGDCVFAVCSDGVLEASVISPEAVTHARPLLALHGISRNSEELCAAFSEAAAQSGRVVVVPHFSAEAWPVFQRITRRARPDKALLALFSTLRGLSDHFQGPFDVFGFSGGAQLAHRFAMLYPELVGDLHLGAAGWYTFPDECCNYPYGIRDAQGSKQSWGQRMYSGLNTFLQRDITVYVGEQDVERDASLRVNAQLDKQQGRNRLERAQSYIARINELQTGLGLPPTGRLITLAGCGHSFSDCAENSGLATLCCAPR